MHENVDGFEEHRKTFAVLAALPARGHGWHVCVGQLDTFGLLGM